jgi:hypothetical protein
MHFEVHESDQGAVRVHHDPHVCHTVIQAYRHTGIQALSDSPTV